MKFVINDCYGGYTYSKDFLNKYGKEIGSLERNDPKLVAAVEEFGLRNASGIYPRFALKKFLTMLLTTPSRSMTERKA